MTEHMKQSESELNELLAEYWKLRHDAGGCILLWHGITLMGNS